MDIHTQSSVTDPFTSRLVKILVELKHIQPLVLGIHRSDYMLDNGEDLKQIEINTISSGFLGLGSVTPALQDFALNYFVDESIIKQLRQNFPVVNRTKESFCDLFDAAVTQYCSIRNVGKKDIVVLMVVQKEERNYVDQRWIQFRLLESKGIKFIRRSLDYIATHGRIDETKSNALLVDGLEVAITYFRAGYTPQDYPSELEWDGRILIEKSFSIKCPNIAYHLIGTKKMQQVLEEPNVLEKFLTVEEAEFVRSSFVEMHGFEKGDIESLKEIVYKNPKTYVMKPQREGGGNLLAGEEMVEFLKKDEDLVDYILMKRINPIPLPSLTFSMSRSPQELLVEDTICELGVYGFVLANNDSLLYNTSGGYLLRSKSSNMEDGGVASGRAYIDAPLLIE